jgi:uracil-DNA glycosylase family 4
MDEFSEEELTLFVNRALAQSEGSHPFSANPLGLAETDILEALHHRLSKRFIESQVNDIFQDVRSDIVSRKVPLTLSELHTVTRNCNKCSITATAELPKWNVTDPDIVVVIDSSSLPAEAVAVMIDAFKMANIGSSQLCLTYVNRCPAYRSYEEQEVSNCSPYLHSEIQLLNPKLVVCMGNLAASVLFGAPLKMKDIHGEIRWLGYWPILSTYSPMYVSRSSEFENSNIAQQFQQDIVQAKKFITAKSTSL